MHLFIGTSSCGDLHTIFATIILCFILLYYFDPFHVCVVCFYIFFLFLAFTILQIFDCAQINYKASVI